eukprot:gene9211-1297_t
MEYINSLIEFGKRNKKKLLIGTALSGVVYYMYQDNLIKKLEEETKKSYFNSMRQLYQTNHNISNTAVRTVLARTLNALTEQNNLEELFTTLRSVKDLTSEDKKKIWEEIKCSSFSRSIVAIYSLVFIHMMVSVQIFMMGRYLLIKYIEKEEKVEEYMEISIEEQQEFLNYSSKFQEESFKKFSVFVNKIVDEELKNFSLKKVCSYEEISLVILKIRTRVENFLLEQTDDIMNLSSILLPPEEEDSKIQQKNLTVLISELRDIIEGKEFTSILKNLCDESFDVFNFKINQIISKLSFEQKNYIANIVSGVTKEFSIILDSGDDNQYLNEIQRNQNFDTFCLVIYSMGIEL